MRCILQKRNKMLSVDTAVHFAFNLQKKLNSGNSFQFCATLRINQDDDVDGEGDWLFISVGCDRLYSMSPKRSEATCRTTGA